MTTINNLPDFLNRLQSKSIHYTIDRTRTDPIAVRIEVWRERWEVEFFLAGEIEVEVFNIHGGVNVIDNGESSAGKEGAEALERLLKKFSDSKRSI